MPAGPAEARARLTRRTRGVARKGRILRVTYVAAAEQDAGPDPHRRARLSAGPGPGRRAPAEAHRGPGRARPTALRRAGEDRPADRGHVPRPEAHGVRAPRQDQDRPPPAQEDHGREVVVGTGAAVATAAAVFAVRKIVESSLSSSNGSGSLSGAANGNGWNLAGPAARYDRPGRVAFPSVRLLCIFDAGTGCDRRQGVSAQLAPVEGRAHPESGRRMVRSRREVVAMQCGIAVPVGPPSGPRPRFGVR
jgi:hypothetical protein